MEGLHATVQVWVKGRAPETVDLFTCFELYAFKAGFFITSQIEFSSKYRSKTWNELIYHPNKMGSDFT